MKKNYTKKQITEAIAYWQGKLKMMCESISANDLKTKLSDDGYDHQFRSDFDSHFMMLLNDISQWIDDGGDFNSPTNDNAKVGGILTNDDVGNIISYIHDPSHSPKMSNVVDKMVAKYGKVVDFPLYRGISDQEYHSIMNAVQKHPQSLKLNSMKSFSKDIDIARSFSEFGGGGSLSKDKTLDIDKDKRLITLHASKPVIDYYEFLEAYFLAFYVKDIMPVEDLDDQISMFDEAEYLVSTKYDFNIVDLESMTFSI